MTILPKRLASLRRGRRFTVDTWTGFGRLFFCKKNQTCLLTWAVVYIRFNWKLAIGSCRGSILCGGHLESLKQNSSIKCGHCNSKILTRVFEMSQYCICIFKNFSKLDGVHLESKIFYFFFRLQIHRIKSLWDIKVFFYVRSRSIIKTTSFFCHIVCWSGSKI
jgi:hypothetical protein